MTALNMKWPSFLCYWQGFVNCTFSYQTLSSHVHFFGKINIATMISSCFQFHAWLPYTFPSLFLYYYYTHISQVV